MRIIYISLQMKPQIFQNSYQLIVVFKCYYKNIVKEICVGFVNVSNEKSVN